MQEHTCLHRLKTKTPIFSKKSTQFEACLSIADCDVSHGENFRNSMTTTMAAIDADHLMLVIEIASHISVPTLIALYLFDKMSEPPPIMGTPAIHPFATLNATNIKNKVYRNEISQQWQLGLIRFLIFALFLLSVSIFSNNNINKTHLIVESFCFFIPRTGPF